jgi:hypothetical protein
MLSNDIGQTFIGIINNVLQLIGLRREDGSTFDIGSVISGSVENLIKGAIGTENYQELTTAWAKANRIYQASTNILNSFQNLTSTVLSGLELVAGQTGKIGRYHDIRRGKELNEALTKLRAWEDKSRAEKQALYKAQRGSSVRVNAKRVKGYVESFGLAGRIYLPVKLLSGTQTANSTLIGIVRDAAATTGRTIAVGFTLPTGGILSGLRMLGLLSGVTRVQTMILIWLVLNLKLMLFKYESFYSK